MVRGFDSISITQFPAMICSVSAEGSLNRVAHSIQIFLLLTLSKSFLFNLCAFAACSPFSSAQSYLVRFQPLGQSHDIGNQNFASLHSGFIITDFDEAADMQCWHYLSHTKFWFGYLNWCDLFQVTGTEASCVLYIICSQFINFKQVSLCSAYCVWFFALLAFSLICFWLNLIVQFTSEFSLSCADLCKVSTEESDYVISQMIVLIAEIEGNCFDTILSILLVWRRSDLFNVNLQITGYVSLHNQTPLHITLSKLVVTSHCMFLLYNNLPSAISIHHQCCFVSMTPIQ